MKVSIKSFDVQMEVKNSGIELEVRDAAGKQQLGDLVITKTQLIWCRGRTTRAKGIAVAWEDFIRWMES